MVRDVRGPEWSFIQFQILDWVVKSLESPLDSLETDRGLFVFGLCVDMLLLICYCYD